MSGTAKELLEQPDGEGGGSSLEIACPFLRRKLAEGGPIPPTTVCERASDEDLTWGAMRREADELMVIKIKDGASGTCFWKLPSRDRPTEPG